MDDFFGGEKEALAWKLDRPWNPARACRLSQGSESGLKLKEREKCLRVVNKRGIEVRKAEAVAAVISYFLSREVVAFCGPMALLL